LCLDELFFKYRSFKKYFITEFEDIKSNIHNKSDVILDYLKDKEEGLVESLSNIGKSINDAKESILNYVYQCLIIR
jgi:hypothetical protein